MGGAYQLWPKDIYSKNVYTLRSGLNTYREGAFGISVFECKFFLDAVGQNRRGTERASKYLRFRHSVHGGFSVRCLCQLMVMARWKVL